MIAAIRRAVGKPDLKVKKLPWWLLKLTAPFNETVRELGEMKGLWQTSIRLDNAKLVSFLGHEPHTPLDEAVAVTLKSLKIIQ